MQSRYYDPAIGRFLNADAFASTGQGLLGNNMFAYCGNNPINRVDYAGERYVEYNGELIGSGKIDLALVYPEELAVLNTTGFSLYNNIPVLKLPFGENVGFSAGMIILGAGLNADENGISTLRHEYGHVVHLSQIGWESYITWVLIPSVTNYWRGVLYVDYYSQPWEYIADKLGNVNRTYNSQPYQYAPYAQERADAYYQFTFNYVGNIS